jgi:hypothetical protein
MIVSLGQRQLGEDAVYVLLDCAVTPQLAPVGWSHVAQLRR